MTKEDEASSSMYQEKTIVAYPENCPEEDQEIKSFLVSISLGSTYRVIRGDQRG